MSLAHIARKLSYLLPALSFGGALAQQALDSESYNQWKLAGGQITKPGEIHAAEGFRVELLRSAHEGEGSWVAMTFDPEGKVIIAREDRGLMRLDPKQGEQAESALVDDSVLEARGLLFYQGALFANANNSRALVRLSDLDGDGKFEEAIRLRETPGGVGHGRDQLALGPDGMLYLMHGDDVRAPTSGFTQGSEIAHGRDDRFLPLAWDRFNWSASVRHPAGHVIRTDAEGKRWDLVCVGLRNPFGIAFNEDGEMFTYDADIEWDVGLPWYRPTRVLHLVSGADFGWRGASRALPAWMPETAPPVVDIGKGSPTAIMFGYRGKFPEPWRSALFIMDWAYGRILAVSLEATGASYRGTAKAFLEGRPLNVTGMDFGPDGAMYFTTGGRRTRSALYRVYWPGELAKIPSAKPIDASPSEARAKRRKLEAFHGRTDPRAMEVAWPLLSDPDPWIRQAARVAVESQPLATWEDRVLREASPLAALTGFLAMARMSDGVWPSAYADRLASFDLAKLSNEELLLWLRVLEIGIMREHLPVDAVKPLPAKLHAVFPHASSPCNRLLCELLCHFDDPSVVAKSLAWLDSPSRPSQEDVLHVLLSLRVAKSGWNRERRRQWLAWIARAKASFSGAAALPSTLNHLKLEFEAAMDAEEKTALSVELAALDQATSPVVLPPINRDFQKAWTLADFEKAPEGYKPDLARGRRVFTEANCVACHRSGAEPGLSLVGPDLTGVGQRFDRRAIMESLLDPWRVVAAQYRLASLVMKDGAVHEGPVVLDDAETIGLATNPVDPGAVTKAQRADIAKLTEMSAMPPGLLNTFRQEELMDLVAWLQAGSPP